MTLAKYVNSLGLICDIGGALLLLRFGLPPDIRHGGLHQTFEDLRTVDGAKKSRFERFARFGAWLVITGFSLQLASNFLAS